LNILDSDLVNPSKIKFLFSPITFIQNVL